MTQKSMQKGKEQNVPHYEKLLQGIHEVEQCLECPVCFETDKAMVQCSTGHRVCVTCKNQMENCPLCQSAFTNIKCFLAEDISKKLENLKVSITTLDKDIKLQDEKVKDYKTCRELVKTVTTKLSTFLYKTQDNLMYLSKYVNSPREMEMKLVSLTSDLHQVQYLMNETKDTLIKLKK